MSEEWLKTEGPALYQFRDRLLTTRSLIDMALDLAKEIETNLPRTDEIVNWAETQQDLIDMRQKIEVLISKIP